MTTEMIKEIAEIIMIKVRVEKLYEDDEIFKMNRRFNPYHSERVGIEQMLKVMGIDFEYGFNEKYEITSITIQGITVEA